MLSYFQISWPERLKNKKEEKEGKKGRRKEGRERGKKGGKRDSKILTAMPSKSTL